MKKSEEKLETNHLTSILKIYKQIPPQANNERNYQTKLQICFNTPVIFWTFLYLCLNI